MGFNARSEIVNNCLEINIPRQSILYLRSNSNVPDEMFYKINTSEGSAMHKVHVDKMSNYSLSDILDNNLLFLLPFYIFTFERILTQKSKNKNYMQRINNDYTTIAKHLDKLTENSDIDNYTKNALIDFIKRVVGKLANNNADVKKRS